MEFKRLENDNIDNNIQQMLIYRSLYILKKKVDKYKLQLDYIYKKHSINKTNTAYKVSIDVLNEVYKEIMEMIETNIIHLKHLNELFITNFIKNTEKKKSIEDIQSQLIEYIKANITKYNKMFIQKRLSNQSKKNKIAVIQKQDIESADYLKKYYHSIVEYNKQGKVIKSFEVLIKENNDSVILLSINQTKEPVNDNNIDCNNKGNNEESNNTDLYIEMLPFIIADYIQNVSSIVIIDKNEEFNNEIYFLFDKKIISKLEEDVSSNQAWINKSDNCKHKLSEFQKERNSLLNNIHLYQNIFDEKKKRCETTVVIEDMLEKLISQKIILDNKIGQTRKIEEDIKLKKEKQIVKLKSTSVINKDINNNRYEIIDQENERVSALKYIFSFYSKKFNSIGSFFLCETIQHKSRHINRYIILADFLTFCKDFNIALSKERIIDLFKKYTVNQKTMLFNEFISILQQFAMHLHNIKKKHLRKKIENGKETITLMEQKELEREEEGKIGNLFTEKTTGIKQNKIGTIDKASIFYHNTHNQLIENVSKLLYDLECLLRKPEEIIMNDFYSNYLGINNSKEYKNRIKGYLLPKCTTDTKYKLPNQLIKIKNSIENKDLLFMLENKKADIDNEIKKKEIYEEGQLYQIKMKYFLSNHKKLPKHSMERIKDKFYTDIMIKHSLSLSNSIKEEYLKSLKNSLFVPSNMLSSNSNVMESNDIDYINQINKNTNSNDNNSELIISNKINNQNASDQMRKSNEEDNESNKSQIENKELIIEEQIDDNIKSKEAQIINYLNKSAKRLSSLLKDPLLKQLNNNSMIEVKHKSNDLSALDNNHSIIINNSYQLLSSNINKEKKYILFTAGEHIVNNQPIRNTPRIKFNHSHSQHSINNSIYSTKLQK